MAEAVTTAVLAEGKLVCTKCGPVEPRLIELGYIITHNFQRIEDGEIYRRGLNRLPRDVAAVGLPTPRGDLGGNAEFTAMAE